MVEELKNEEDEQAATKLLKEGRTGNFGKWTLDLQPQKTCSRKRKIRGMKIDRHNAPRVSKHNCEET